MCDLPALVAVQKWTYGCGMSSLRDALNDLVERRISLEEIAVALDVSLSTVKRRTGADVSADDAIRAARAFGAPVIELLIELGHLTSDDVAEVNDVVRVTSLDGFTDLELAQEILERVKHKTGHEGQVVVQVKPADDYLLAASDADYDDEAEAQQNEP